MSFLNNPVRKAVRVAFAFALISACGSTPPTKHITVQEKPTPMHATPTRAPELSPLAAADGAIAKVQKWNETIVFNAVVANAKAEADAARIEAVAVAAPKPAATVSLYPVPTDLASVMQCIKEHESGNYSESTHPDSGSGAYQFIPSTWRTWSERAGHGGYAYAYLAPPEVQDAVIVYALTNGGAGNWSPKFGDDPCTVGMGG